MLLKNRMLAIRSYGTVGESAGNRRLYPDFQQFRGFFC